MKNLISIIIPVHNGALTIELCLDALYRSIGIDYEVIVVDDASNDNTVDIIRKFDCKILQMKEQGGPAIARNLGVANSSGDIIFFTDADVAVFPDTILKASEYLNKHFEIDAVIGSYSAETPARNFTSRYKNYLHHYTHQLYNGEVSSFFTACGAIRRSVFDTLEGFDETINTTALEDVDLGYRIHTLGLRVRLLSSIKVTHLKRYSLFSLFMSDFFHRAIPYTKLMISHNNYKNELSTGTKNIFSVFLIFILLITTVLSICFKNVFISISCLGIFTALIFVNLSFYMFLNSRAGICFTILGIIMQIWGYLYSGFGVLLGLLQYFIIEKLLWKGCVKN